MIPKLGQLASGRPGKTVRKGEASAVGVDAPAADAPLADCVRLLYYSDTFSQEIGETPTPMRREQGRQSGWTSTDNHYACTTKAQGHLLRRDLPWQATP
jgi:hypothetical protein